MSVQSQISVLKIFENEEKWLINVSEEPDMINSTLDNGRSLRQLIIGVSLFLAFQAITIGKVKNMLNSDQQQIKICFMLFPVSGMVITASVKLSGELMQEIHQI